ncbi:MAG: type II toxin-antitoxin system VapC family toxin [Sphingomonas sp.]
MRLLLDTHIAIWAVLDAPMLTTHARQLIQDPANTVAVSLASLWEIAIKNGRKPEGKGAIGFSVGSARDEFAAASFDIQPFDIAVLQAVEQLPRHHGDPFDRLIVATAMTYDYRLLTHDRALAAYGERILTV